MTHGFDADYWEDHWRGVGARDGHRQAPANPYLATGTEGLVPGTALDAGCGEGAEAIWLAEHGWRVTAADISAEVLARATERAVTSPAADRIDWRRADLGTWEPGGVFDLVTTHYAHPAMPQLAFYERIAAWVAPGGTLLVVGHHPEDLATGLRHGHHTFLFTADSLLPALGDGTGDPAGWEVEVCESRPRTQAHPETGEEIAIADAVLRARRLP
jgi:2-polyprenyl-3-methyl-5-hydroxy-6-metoxy-1,4-benzoquinol methylase